MEEKQKIEILLKEYDALRVEILQRVSSRFNFLGLFGAAGAGLLFTAEVTSSLQKIVLFATALLLLGIWIQLGNIVARCSKRISEIEEDINRRAGENLLKWESKQIGSKYFHIFHK